MNARVDQALLSALAWQIELGADEAISDTPIDRFQDSGPARAPAPAAGSPAAAAPRGPGGPTGAAPDPRPGRTGPRPDIPDATAVAGAAETLDDLAEAMRAWPGSPLREGARNLVFSDGNPAARVMVIGEAPGADEDRAGRPFVGRAGQLLDRMLAAIGLSRDAPDPEHAVYITNMLPWRPPGNRTPTDQEALAFLPFVVRHIELADPDLILSMGNTPTKPLMATRTGIKKMRGRWVRHGPTGKPLLPTFHPAYLLRTPSEKKLSWLDLLALQKALEEGPPP